MCIVMENGENDGDTEFKRKKGAQSVCDLVFSGVLVSL